MKRLSWASTGWSRHTACCWSVLSDPRSPSLSKHVGGVVDADGADQLILQVGVADEHGLLEPGGADPAANLRFLAGVTQRRQSEGHRSVLGDDSPDGAGTADRRRGNTLRRQIAATTRSERLDCDLIRAST